MNAKQALEITRAARPPVRPYHILKEIERCANLGLRRYELGCEECHGHHQWWLIENGYSLETIVPVTSVGQERVIAISW